MRADLKGGKIVFTLHEVDKRTLIKAAEIMGCIAQHSSAALQATCDVGAKAIGDALVRLCAETPENDTGKQVEQQPAGKAKVA